jgi:hypothetical protein
MKKGRFFVTGMLAAALTFGVLSAACKNGTSPGNDDPPELAFSVSGTFTRTDTSGNNEVKFEVKSDAARSALGRAVTTDSYAISGALEDGSLTIRLKGSYDPNSGKWSVSAKSSAVI